MARSAGLSWKMLEVIYDRGRVQLWRCVELAAAHMKQNTPGMKHRGAGPGSILPAILPTFDDQRALEGSMGGGGSSQPAPPPVVAPPPPPTLSDPAVSAASRAEQQAAARARGRASTALTGGAGLMMAAPSQQKMLLGQ